MFAEKKIGELIIVLIFAGFTMLASDVARAEETGLIVSDPWVRMAPPTLKTHGGYLTLTNRGQERKELTGAFSENYGDVQIHLSKIIDGVATMQRMESVEIAPGKTVEFKPGELHMMLMSAKEPLKKGNTVPITLSFRSGETINVKAMIMMSAPAGSEMKEMDDSGDGGHHTH